MTNENTQPAKRHVVADSIRRSAERELTSKLVCTAVTQRLGHESSGSPLIGLLEVVESAEDGLTASAPSGQQTGDLADRFPELRDVRMPSGNEARFPELFVDEQVQNDDEREVPEAYTR